MGALCLHSRRTRAAAHSTVVAPPHALLSPPLEAPPLPPRLPQLQSSSAIRLPLLLPSTRNLWESNGRLQPRSRPRPQGGRRPRACDADARAAQACGLGSQWPLLQVMMISSLVMSQVLDNSVGGGDIAGTRETRVYTRATHRLALRRSGRAFIRHPATHRTPRRPENDLRTLWRPLFAATTA